MYIVTFRQKSALKLKGYKYSYGISQSEQAGQIFFCFDERKPYSHHAAARNRSSNSLTTTKPPAASTRLVQKSPFICSSRSRGSCGANWGGKPSIVSLKKSPRSLGQAAPCCLQKTANRRPRVARRKQTVWR